MRQPAGLGLSGLHRGLYPDLHPSFADSSRVTSKLLAHACPLPVPWQAFLALVGTLACTAILQDYLNGVGLSMSRQDAASQGLFQALRTICVCSKAALIRSATSLLGDFKAGLTPLALLVGDTSAPWFSAAGSCRSSSRNQRMKRPEA